MNGDECCSGRCEGGPPGVCAGALGSGACPGKPLDAQCNAGSECCSGVCSVFPGNEFLVGPDPTQGKCEWHETPGLSFSACLECSA
jgi:hypothetical protein